MVEQERRDHRRRHRRAGAEGRRRPVPGKVERVGIEQFTPFMRMILLQSIDQHWREHLAALDYLRQGIHLRGYAQKNPKQEYKREAFELFSQLLDVVKMDVTRILMTVRIQSEEEVREAARRSRSAPSTSATSPTRTPTRTAASRRSAAAIAGGTGGDRRGGGGDGVVTRRRPRRGAEGRPQRPLPVRQRQEVQAVPRQARLKAASQASKACFPRSR